MTMGLGLGELVYVAAGIAYLVEEGDGDLRGRAGSRRKLLVTVHMALVLTGLEVAVARADLGPGWLWTAIRVANILSLAIVPVVIVKGYPKRLRAMIDTTLTPLLLGAAWAAAEQLLDGHRRIEWDDALLQPIVFLGLHHLAVIAPLLLQILLDPPERAAAADLTLRERLTSGLGIFWLVLMGLWLTQAVMTLVALGELAFGTGVLSGAIGAGLFLVSVARAVRRLRFQVVQGA